MLDGNSEDLEARHARAVAYLLKERERGGFEAVVQIAETCGGSIGIENEPDGLGFLAYVTAPDDPDPDKFDPDQLFTAIGQGFTITHALTDAVADILMLQGQY